MSFNTFALNSTSGGIGTTTGPDLTVGAYTELAVDLNLASSTTAGTIKVQCQRKGADGVYYPLDDSGTIAGPTGTISRSIGIGLAQNVEFGSICRFLVITTGFTVAAWTLSVIAK